MPQMLMPDVDLCGNHILVPVWEDTPDAPEDRVGLTDAERRFMVERRTCLERAQRTRGWSKIAAVHEYMPLLDDDERIAALLPLIEHEPAETFWPIFIHWWPTCDRTWKWNARLVKILRRVGPCSHYLYAYLYATDQGVFFDSLPDRITIFRGANRRRIHGAISWTTDIEIARDFARGHYGIVVPDPVVATAMVDKAEIFLATNNRDEREILALPRCILNVKSL